VTTDFAGAASACRLSIVVLTHNRREQVIATVGRLLQLPERAPLIVVDNGSSDGTTRAVRERYDDVRQLSVVRIPYNLGAAARNAGVFLARTPYVAFCDDDVTWHPGALDTACRLLDAHPRIAVLCAHLLVGERGLPDPTSLAMARSQLDSDGLPGRAIAGFFAGASVMRIDAFLQTGGYRPEFFIGGEEELIALDLLSAGWQLVYVPDVIAHHFPSPMRDVAARRHLLARNAIWVACMRYPMRAALRRTCQQIFAGWRARTLWPLLIDTCAGLPWALAERRVVPRAVGEQLRRARGR
jgi:GT2 family glycosyltransferase